MLGLNFQQFLKLRYFRFQPCSPLPERILTNIAIPFKTDIIIKFLIFFFKRTFKLLTTTACDEIVERMPNCPKIKHGKQQAYYEPATDHINMPKQGSFDTPSSYYCTLFHELVHSTGHPSRLNRKEIAEPNKYGSDPYSIEELTAEIGACYLNSIAGIVNKEFDNSVAYIKGWIEKLKSNKRFILYASGQAQRATDYILNVQSLQKNEEILVE